jgi:hypothetical protein
MAQSVKFGKIFTGPPKIQIKQSKTSRSTMPAEKVGARTFNKCYIAPIMEFSDDHWADLYNV